MGVKIESAISWAVAIANDNSHGYSQSNRWGPHYDCSSFLITAYQQAGIPVKSNGASTTADMYSAFLKTDFSDVTSQVNFSSGSGMLRGDVILRPKTSTNGGHTVMYIGDGKIVHASSPTNGILVANYYSSSWKYVLRHSEATTGTTTTEGEENMVCFYQVDGTGPVRFYDGVSIHALAHADEKTVLNNIYKANTGKDIPFFAWKSSTPWHIRLQDAIKRGA